MKAKIILTFLTLATILVACAPKATPSPEPSQAPVMSETTVTTEATASMEPTSVSSVDTPIPPVPVTPGNVFEVEISGFAFEENSITIKVGDMVTWTNHDSAPHSVVADDGSFKSNSLSNDASFSHTFDTAGTFTYHCGFHSSMTGTVIVEP